MDQDGSQPTMLTATGSNLQPAWSFEGHHIAFVSNRDGDSEVYVMASDGSGQTNLTMSPGSDEFDPSWHRW
jgi:TolB protein